MAHLFKKMSDIIRSNISALLEEAEDPEKMIKLYLEDAESHLPEAKAAVHAAIQAEKELQAKYDVLKADVSLWAQRADNAVKKEKDDLARQALEQKRATQEKLAKLEGPLAQAKTQATKARSDLSVLESKVEEARDEGQILIARAKSAKAIKGTADALAGIKSHDPLAGIRSMETKIASQEAAAAASTEVAGIDSEKVILEKEFRALDGPSVEEELAALKKKHAAAPPA